MIALESTMLRSWDDLMAPHVENHDHGIENFIAQRAASLASTRWARVSLNFKARATFGATNKLYDLDLHYSGKFGKLDERTGTTKFLKEDSVKSNDRHVVLLARSRVQMAARLLINVLTVSILITPIVVLYQIPDKSMRLWVISLFTITFSSFLAFSTGSRVSEIFAATAA